MRHLTIFVGVVSLALVACGGPVADPADTVYINGTILTMDDNQPAVEAVAVQNGRIMAAPPSAHRV